MLAEAPPEPEPLRAISLPDLKKILQKGCRSPEYQAALPQFCRLIRETEIGRELCDKALSAVEQLSKEVEYPYVFCCWAGAKVEVIPTQANTGSMVTAERPDEATGLQGEETGSRVYLAFCRSPYPDERRLELLYEQKILKHPFLDIKKAFKALPKFSGDFAREINNILAKENVAVPESVAKEAEELGKAYSPFELDIVLSNTLLEGAKDTQGKLCIRVKVKPKDTDAPTIIRVVLHKAPGTEGDGWACGMPIVGLVVRDESASDKVDRMCKVLCRAMFGEAAENVKGYLYTPQGPFPPNCHVEIELLPDLSADPSKRKMWLDSVGRLIISALYVSGPTGTKALLDKLGEGPEPGWSEFKNLLQVFFVPLFQDYRLTVKEHTSIHGMLFHDLNAALDNLRPEAIPIRFRDIRDAIEDFSRALSAYSITDWAPDRHKEPRERQELRELLAQDLLRGEKRYVTRVVREAIPLYLRRWDFEKDTVRRCLEIDPEVAVAALLDAVERAETGGASKTAIQTVLEWCREDKTYSVGENGGFKRPREDLKAFLGKDLYNLAASPARREWGLFWTTFVGMAASSLTLGYQPAAPIIRHLQDRACSRYLKILGLRS